MNAASAACPRCSTPVIGDVAVVLAPEHDEQTGLLGWASAVVGIFCLDGLAVRLNRDGALSVSWPARRGHPTIVPLDPDLYRQIEDVVLRAYIAERAKRRHVPTFPSGGAS